MDTDFQRNQQPRVLFVSGTGTGVGKTWVSAALAQQALDQGKSVIYYKPVQTGTPQGELPEDPAFVNSSTNGRARVECRYIFEMPTAPSVADDDHLITFDQIKSDIDEYAAQCDLLIVEGAGGLMVPVTPHLLTIEMIRQLQLPVVLVAHSGLGTMNHTLLSIEALQNKNISLAQLVFNFYPAHPEMADPAIKTLLNGIRPFLPEALPLWSMTDQAEFNAFSLKPLSIG